MPFLMMMKIDGVSGDSKSFKHKGWADVLSWNWGLTSNRKLAHDDSSDKTSLNELSVIKRIGSDSSGTRLLFAQGSIIANVELAVSTVVAKRETPQNYVNITLQDVRIKSIIAGGSIEDDFFKEHITLLYDRIRFEYHRYILSSTQTEEDRPIVENFAWNVPANAEWEN